MSSSTNNVIRPLGNYERLWQVAHDLDYHYNAGLIIRYKIPIDLSLHPSVSSTIPDETKNIILRILYPTLEQIILKHSELAVSFADLHTSKPLFIRLSEIDLSKIVRLVVVNDDDNLIQMLEEEHAKKFNVQDNSVPLWRIVVGIKGTSVVKEELSDWNLIVSLSYHHSILDGKSSLAFYSTFNESLSEMLSKDHSLQDSSKELTSKITLPQKSAKPFCKPIEHCVDFNCPLSFAIKEIFKQMLLPKFFREKLFKGYWLGDVHKSSLPKYTTKLLLYSITAEELQSLLKQSRQHKTTI